MDVAGRVRGLMPQLRKDLEALVRIPSVSVPGRIDQPLLDAFEMTSRLFAQAGVEVGRLDLPDTAPVVTGHIPAPPGAPTVLLYSHYDVVPAGNEDEWLSPPFEPTERDGALFGRGAADTKSNILMHVGALRAREPHGHGACGLPLRGLLEVRTADAGAVLRRRGLSGPGDLVVLSAAAGKRLLRHALLRAARAATAAAQSS